MLKIPEHKRLLPLLMSACCSSALEGQEGKRIAHTLGFSIIRVGTTRFAKENSFLHVKEIKNPSTHATPSHLCLAVLKGF